MDSNSKDYENSPSDGNHYYDQYGNRVESPTPAPSHNNGFHQMYYNNTNTDNNDDYEADNYSMNHKIINYNYPRNFEDDSDEEHQDDLQDTYTPTAPVYFYEKYNEDMKNNPDLNVHSTSYDTFDETFNEEFQGDFKEDFKEDSQENLHHEESNSFIHALEVAKAALPYLGGELQPIATLFIKAGELMESIALFQKRGPISTYSIKKPMDLEGLLTNIRSVCYQKEREIVDMILNFLKMKNIFETYQTITQMTSGSNMFDMNSPDMMQNLFQMFGNGNSPDMMQNLFQMFGNGNSPDTNPFQATEHDDNHVNSQEENANTKDTSNNTSHNTNQNNMTEILQTLLTPEQRETFNTLSTLLQSSQ